VFQVIFPVRFPDSECGMSGCALEPQAKYSRQPENLTNRYLRGRDARLRRSTP
jgi:hypothetical protein